MRMVNSRLLPAATDWSCLMVAVGENVWVENWSWQNKENLWETWHATRATFPLWPRLMFLPFLQRNQTQSHQSFLAWRISLNHFTRWSQSNTAFLFWPLHHTIDHLILFIVDKSFGQSSSKLKCNKIPSFSVSLISKLLLLPPFVTLYLSVIFTHRSYCSHSFTIHTKGLFPVVGGSMGAYCL